MNSMESSVNCCPGHFVLSNWGRATDCLHECIYNVEDFQISAERLPHEAQEFIESWRQLQMGTPNAAELQVRISPYLEDIIKKNFLNENILFHNSRCHHRVFELKSFPQWIFKSATSDEDPPEDVRGDILGSFIQMAQAQTVIRVDGLKFLVIPRSQTFPVSLDDRIFIFLVQQKLDFAPYFDAQEKLFCRDSMDEPIKQCAQLLCKIPCDDVNWSNFVVLSGTNQIGLLDYERIDKDCPKIAGVIRGLFGGGLSRTSRGLVGCVNEHQGEIIEEVAREKAIPTEEFAEAQQQRIREIKKDQEMADFYLQHNIQHGDDPIKVKDLDFSDAPADMAEKLTTWTCAIIGKTNASLSKLLRGRLIWQHRNVVFPVSSATVDQIDTSFIQDGNVVQEEEKNPRLDFLSKFGERAFEGRVMTAKIQRKAKHFLTPEQEKLLEKWRLMTAPKREQIQYRRRWLGYILNKLVCFGAAYSCAEKRGGKKNKIVSYHVQF
jgi:hypothetical protein